MKANLQMDGPGAAPRDASPEFRALVERLYGLSRFGVKLGLERMERLLADLGHPERTFRAVHVAGSNGKGSTSAFLATILARHGLRVGLYTSPHLVSVTERVQVLEGASAPRAISQERLVEAVGAVEAVRPGLEGLTFFEVITAAGLVALRAERVELAVVEAGLGARLDATRVVPAELGILTDLSLEHTAILGDTIEEIAADEGEVCRPGRPLVAADGPSAAMRVIDEIVARKQATLHRIGGELAVEQLGPATFRLTLGARVLEDVRLSLIGPHQGRNAALAAMAASLVAPDVTDETLRAGLLEARWPGRMEVFETPSGVRVLLDGAQNPHAARALARALSSREELRGPLHFVFGALGDKDVASMLEVLEPLARSFAFTRPASIRARDPASLGRYLRGGAGRPVDAEDAIADAFARAHARAEADGGWVVVCGSLYLVGDVRAALLGA